MQVFSPIYCVTRSTAIGQSVNAVHDQNALIIIGITILPLDLDQLYRKYQKDIVKYI